ncbi:efflux RND transporter permease subunit [Evansella cellulosilytica]|nr:MMPL family transporter [Evansella cellulosilytica]
MRGSSSHFRASKEMVQIDIAARIVKHKKLIVVFFMVLAVVSAIVQFFVSVNYNMVDYLPDEAQSTKAMEVMEQEFSGSVPNTRVMIHDVTVQEALIFKEELSAIDGVYDVTWLDDEIDLKTPLEMANEDTVESYFKDNKALFSFSIRQGEEVEVTDEIYALIGEDNALAGEAVDTAESQKMAGAEAVYAAALLIPIIIFILVISTTSWVEPVFFLTAIGVSVLINLGTNIFLGEVSFVTQSVAPILQLAVSLDYAIFLLHSFHDYRKKVENPEEAMQLAIKKSFPAIASSAATTFFGFIALTFMQFEIGADLGVNLVKGIVLSFISVMVFLPALTLLFYKWMDKTKHKQFIPDFKGVGNVVMKLRVPSLLIVFILIVPSFLAQSSTTFTYGIGEHPDTTRAGSDFYAIEEEFGQLTPIVVLVPRGDIVKEAQLSDDFKKMDHVKSVLSYTSTVSPAIPPEYLDSAITEQFYSENYSRIILYTDTEKEGDIPFAVVEAVQSAAGYYYDDYYTLGESVTLYDIKSTVTQDNLVVNVLTVVAIAIVLLVTFRSITIPIVLLLTIQSAVWINLAVPYFTDSPLVFVGYLIISTVQLAATVDYGILFTEDYKERRKEMPALTAIKQTVDKKIFSISISASILSSVGFILWITSTNPIVSSIGLLLGRGALLAFIMVVFFLPAMLYISDKLIEKTTWKANFYKEK